MARIANATARVSLVLASTLFFAGIAAAVEAAPDAAPAGGNPAPTMELDEVWVHGKRLADRIEEAEDAFFGLYNELNDDDRFDVHCGLTILQRGSMIMQRTCVPGFIADRVPIYRQARSFRPYSLMTSAVCQGSPTADNGAVHFEGGCYGAPMDQYPSGLMDHYHLAMVEAVHYREQYAQTLIEVIEGDARLHEKAAHLSTLYTELAATQQHYRDMRALTPATWSMQRKLGSPGPR